MDLLTFISNLVQNLAWPVTVLIIVVILRKPLANLILLLQRLKYKDLELDFGKRVEEAKAEAAQELPAEIPETATPTPAKEAIARLAEVSPRAAVLEAWRNVELAALAAAKTIVGEKFHNKTMTYQAIRALEQQEDIDRSAISLLKELRALRNDAAHAPDFALSQESALEYAAVTDRVARYLYSIRDGFLPRRVVVNNE